MQNTNDVEMYITYPFGGGHSTFQHTLIITSHFKNTLPTFFPSDPVTPPVEKTAATACFTNRHDISESLWSVDQELGLKSSRDCQLYPK